VHRPFGSPVQILPCCTRPARGLVRRRGRYGHAAPWPALWVGTPAYLAFGGSFKNERSRLFAHARRSFRSPLLAPLPPITFLKGLHLSPRSPLSPLIYICDECYVCERSERNGKPFPRGVGRAPRVADPLKKDTHTLAPFIGAMDAKGATDTEGAMDARGARGCK
jgi:hypothetical protein